MGKKPFLLLGTAVLIALITSLLIYGYLKKSRANHVAVQTESVAVAAVDLLWGTKLTKEMMKQVDVPIGSLPGDFFSDPTAIIGRVLIYPVKANEPIFGTRLAPKHIKTGGVAAVVSPNKRAMAVKVDKVIGVSGFIHPGNRVDVLITLATGKTLASVTKTILENILVLAVGSETKEKRGIEERSASVDVITLEVTPEEAEKLALATTEGKLQLVLRNFSDTEPILTQGTSISNLLSSYSSQGPPKEVKPPVRKESEPKKVAPPPPPPPEIKKVEVEKPKPFIVEMIKGNKTSEVKFEGSD
jgi:pilus assembly protein CpaB